jgi:hypothetical protein
MKADAPTYKPNVISASDLYARDFGQVRWAVEGLIPEGATILAGKPKMGKSWLALNVALAVASGGIALGRVRVEQGEVLYLALEDGPRRLQRRLKKLLEPTTSPAPADLLLTCEWARTNEGGLAALAKWLTERTATRLVVIDTLAKVRSKRIMGASIYAEDYEAIGTMQSLALEAGVAVLIVAHTRKSSREEQEPDDPLEEVSGSLGLTGAADAVLVLKRQRHGREGTLFLTGRDVEETTLSVEWDAEYCHWELKGEADGVALSSDQRSVLELLSNSLSNYLSVKAISKAFGNGKNYEAVAKMVSRMANDGLLRKDGIGRYALPLPTERT